MKRSWAIKNIFLFVVVVLIVSLIVRFSLGNFFGFYVFFEFSLIPTFFLILGWGYQPERMRARMYIIIYTVGASLPLLRCLVYLLRMQGHLSFHLGFESLVEKGFFSGILFFLFTLAFLVKIPVFFVHLWLPKAHVEAPVAGSIILAGVLLKLGGYGIIRVSSKLGELIEITRIFYISGILWGGVITSVICLRQADMKGLIAYSSIGHIGFFVGGVLRNNV